MTLLFLSNYYNIESITVFYIQRMQLQHTSKPKVKLNFSYNYQTAQSASTNNSFVSPPAFLNFPRPINNSSLQQPTQNRQFKTSSAYVNSQESTFAKQQRGLGLTSAARPYSNHSLVDLKQYSDNHRHLRTQTTCEVTNDLIGRLPTLNGIDDIGIPPLKIDQIVSQKSSFIKSPRQNDLTSSKHSNQRYNYTQEINNLDQKVKQENHQEVLSKQNLELREDLRVEKLKRGDLQDKLLKLKGEYDSQIQMAKNVKNLAQSNNRRQMVNEHYLSQMKSLQEERHNLLQELQSEREKRKMLQQENQDKDSALDGAAGRISMLTDQLESKTKELNDIKGPFAQSENQLRSANYEIKQLKDTIEKRLGQQLSMLKAKTQHFEQKSSEIESQIQKMFVYLSNFKVKNQQTLQQASIEIGILNQYRLKSKQLEEMKQIFTQKSKENSTKATNHQIGLQTQLTKIKKENSELRQANRQLQNNQSILLRQLEDLKNQVGKQ